MIFVVLLINLVISEYPTDIQPPLFDTNEPWLEVCVCVCVCVYWSEGQSADFRPNPHAIVSSAWLLLCLLLVDFHRGCSRA